MPRYFCQIAYKGSNYHGWQIQDNANSVQAEIERVLSTILQAEIGIIGCGRTDTGVHASKYFFHFEYDSAIDIEQIHYKLNSMLPHDISINRIFLVKDDVHARFSASERTYRYKIHLQKDAFLSDCSFHNKKELNLAAMNKACSLLREYTNFTSFSKSNTQVKTNNCKVVHAEWTKIENGYEFVIRADRFLRNMVRAIVGTMLEVGEGKLGLDQVREIIEAKDRSKAKSSVPAQGLFLTDIKYPDF